MKLKQPFIIQVVGYKNSGKTTLVCHLIEVARNLGLNSATIKHHGHGGKPTANENTDSFHHKQAGSIMAGVEGDGELLLSITQSSWTLGQILKFYELVDIDLIFIEGYKHENYPKIVLLSKEEDLSLLSEISNVYAIISSFDSQIKNNHVPMFLRNEQSLIDKWFRNLLYNKEIDLKRKR
ncbi:MAG TPA: molybdopterin-guanine dinucleotide biosynthesis protein B [Ureibacillus sp.]|nr:molybdopterin-guanine dinucleotide biosynthesis protein B [Ureibacillus sp.]